VKKPAGHKPHVHTVGKSGQHPAAGDFGGGWQHHWSTGGKGTSTAKHHPHRHTKHHVKQKRQLALAEGVACCAAEAVAASLRLAGGAVADADVLELYQHTASDPDAGATIWATLQAAGEFGLAGVRPVSFAPVALDDDWAVILGLTLPAPHAVAAARDGWMSWGQLYDPAEWPDAVIEEAWTVTWP